MNQLATYTGSYTWVDLPTENYPKWKFSLGFDTRKQFTGLVRVTNPTGLEALWDVLLPRHGFVKNPSVLMSGGPRQLKPTRCGAVPQWLGKWLAANINSMETLLQ